MRRKLVATGLVLAFAVVALVLAATVSAKSEQTPFKVAWIYVGPHNDNGWSQAHDNGRLAVEKALGSKVETTYKELVPEGPQTCQVIESLINDGNKLIFSTSFGFQACVVTEAKKHPDVLFEQATGTATTKNVAEYFGAGEDSIYLSGMAAGAATKKGVIGYIVPFPIPEVIRHANAFALGAQATHPGAKVRLVWTNNWVSPTLERKAAESLVAAGVDVLGQNVDTPTAGQYAESKKIPWVGYDSNAKKFAPTSWLTAAVYDWSVVLRPAREGRDERHLEDRLLLREHEGRLHRHRTVREARHREDASGHQGEARGDHLREVLRVHRTALRPEGQAPGSRRQEADGPAAVRPELAGQGRDRQREGIGAWGRRIHLS